MLSDNLNILLLLEPLNLILPKYHYTRGKVLFDFFQVNSLVWTFSKLYSAYGCFSHHSVGIKYKYIL